MERSRVMFFVNCFKYIAVPFMVQTYGVAAHMDLIDAQLNGKRQCEEFCAFHIDHIDGCWLNSGSRNTMEHLHVKLLRYLTYALNRDNPIVGKFTNIALRCARSPMGANIALLRHLYYVSIDTMSRLFVIFTSLMIMSNMQQSVYCEIWLTVEMAYMTSIISTTKI